MANRPITIPLPPAIVTKSQIEADKEGISRCAVLRRIIAKHYHGKK